MSPTMPAPESPSFPGEPAVAQGSEAPRHSADSAVAKRVIAALSVAIPVAVAVVVYVIPGSKQAHGPSVLATLNAVFNGAAGCCLVMGYVFVRRRAFAAHKASMLTAVGFSTAFLVSYLLHHARVGSVPFPGEGSVRLVYLSLLVPHIILAAVIVPMALLTVYRGWTGRLAAHRSIARWTLPLWLYVSFSGVLVYWMLYHL
jgi:putative membrane protein